MNMPHRPETARVIDLSPIREKVTKLIALALNNPSQEEAAAAALKACALIREHGLLDMPVVQCAPGTPPQEPPSDLFNFMRRQQQAQQNAYWDIWSNEFSQKWGK